MEELWCKASIHYYCQEKYFGAMYKAATEAHIKFPSDPSYPMFRGISLILEGQLNEGIRELTPLQSDPNINLGCILALIHAHKKSTTTDRELLYTLDTRLKDERKNSTSLSLYNAGIFLYLSGRYEKATDYIAKSLKKDSNNIDTIVLKGWNDMYNNIEKLSPTIADCFELAISRFNKHVEAHLGLAKYKYLSEDHEGSNLVLDKLIVTYPNIQIPLIEKTKNELAMQKWEPVMETIERIFHDDPKCLEALKIKLVLAICKNGDYIEAADQLNQYFTCLESLESQNGYQFYENALIFSRVCGRSSTVLSQVYRFAKYTTEIYPNNPDYLAEIGYHCMMQGKAKEALHFFKAASKIDDNSLNALCGLTYCQLTDTGPSEQIMEQVELLNEMQGMNKHPPLLLMSARMANKNTETALALLSEAAETHLKALRNIPYGTLYLKKLDPDFLLELCKEILIHAPKKATVITGHVLYNTENAPPAVAQCFTILQVMVQACPGLIPSSYELAKLKFMYGHANEAQTLVQHILDDIDTTHANSHILLTQIYIQKCLFIKAAQSLDVCLSYNFKIRDNPMYHLLNAIIQKSNGKNQDALASLTTAMSIVTGGKSSAKARNYENSLNLIDKVTLYLELIDVYSTLGQFADASRVMQEAIQEFSFTTEEGRLKIANAEMALKNSDGDRAIEILTEIKPGQPYFFQAHTKLAYVYLKERNDRTMFTKCFKEVVASHPGSDAHSMLGDAYMSIHEPELAVESYAKALQENSNEVKLIKSMGLALIKSHQFNRAITHYQDAIKKLENDELKTDLVELHIKLKQYDTAESLVLIELDDSKNKAKDNTSIKCRVQLLLLKSKIQKLSSTVATVAVVTLNEAKELQTRIVKRTEMDPRASDLDEEKHLLSSILRSLAAARSAREPSAATNLYAEALLYTPRDADTLLALAKLYAQMNDAEKCAQTCTLLLNADPDNESAALMMADLAFRKVDFDTACRHLNQLLVTNPTSWTALAQLIEVQWRRGTLQEVDPILETAKEALDKPDDPGYCYCAGLVARYNGKPNAALRLLNAARRDPQWGAPAALAMVHLCLAPHDDGHAGDALAETLVDENDYGDTRALALRTAERLLTEVPLPERRPLAALVALGARLRSQTERALQDLLALAGDEAYVDDASVILGLAVAYNQLKQPNRVKNILKRATSGAQWTPEKALSLERCWLLAADGHVVAGRAEAAREVLRRVLYHNQSCGRAYEYLGYLAEKDSNYKAAAQNYDCAWKYNGKSNPTMGYKLAYSYLKLKKYPESIVVCRHILKAHPDFPKIRKDILEKAKTQLRT